MCLAEFDDSEIGRESHFVVVTRDSEGLKCYQPDDQIKVNIFTSEGDHLKTELKDSKDGRYTVIYTPPFVNLHSVEIQVNGQPLTDSPFLLQIQHHYYQFAFKFGSMGSGAGKFGWISDIAVSDRTGTIAVADLGNKRIQLFSSDGTFQMHVKLDGKPSSVAFTDCGDLLTLVSGNNNKLHLFSEEGKFIKHINDYKHLKKPQHLSIGSDGRLIITDEASNEVKVLSPDGNDQLVSITTPNCDKCPQCAVYHQNKFYVSYPGANCIKVFGKTGVYINDIGCRGSSDGQVNYPVGLVIDKCNQLIVCDAMNRRLQLFTLSGKFLRKSEGEYFHNNKPWYAALNNNNGNLIVAGLSGSYIFLNSSGVFDKKRD